MLCVLIIYMRRYGELCIIPTFNPTSTTTNLNFSRKQPIITIIWDSVFIFAHIYLQTLQNVNTTKVL